MKVMSYPQQWIHNNAIIVSLMCLYTCFVKRVETTCSIAIILQGNTVIVLSIFRLKFNYCSYCD